MRLKNLICIKLREKLKGPWRGLVMHLIEQVTSLPVQEYREIQLTRGQVALVSAHRFEYLSRFNWFAYWNSHTHSFYAARNGQSLNGKHVTVWMHREIIGLVVGDRRKVDHEDRNSLNNTDGNLRIATNAQNQHNRSRQRNNTSGFKGVTKLRDSWLAQIGIDGKNVVLGTRATREEAQKLYADAALRYHGSFARLE